MVAGNRCYPKINSVLFGTRTKAPNDTTDESKKLNFAKKLNGVGT
jgi:hypothetical protein